jgi:hypothetical protein
MSHGGSKNESVECAPFHQGAPYVTSSPYILGCTNHNDLAVVDTKMLQKCYMALDPKSWNYTLLSTFHEE